MPVKWREIHFPFAGGVSTKIDEKVIQPPALRSLENGVFTKGSAIKKRNGYTAKSRQVLQAGVSQVTAVRGLTTRANELVLMDDEHLYSLNDSVGKWNQRDTLFSPVIERRTVAKNINSQSDADCAISEGVAVYAWEDSRGGSRFSIVDDTTGAIILDDQSLSATASAVRVITVGCFIHILYVETGSTELLTRIIDPFDPIVSAANSAVSIHTDQNSTLYEAVTFGQAALVVYLESGGSTVVKLFYLLPDGTKGSPGNGSYPAQITLTGLGGPLIALSMNVESSTGIAFVVAQAAAAGTTARTVQTADFSEISSSLIDSFIGTALVRYSIGFELSPDSATGEPTAYVFSDYDAVTGGDENRFIRRVAVSVSSLTSVTTAGVLIRHCGLEVNAFTDPNSDRVFFIGIHESPLQTTYYLIDRDGDVHGRILPGVASPVRAALRGATVTQSGSRFSFCLGRRRRITADVDTVFSEEAIESYTLDFDNSQSHQTVEVGGATYITGGYLQQYDGNTPVEAGFLEFPEFVVGTPAMGSGAMTSSVDYSYRVYAEWTNAQNEREQSTFGAAVSVTMGVSDNEVSLSINTLAFTRKQGDRSDITFAVYRTEADPTARSPFYRVSSLDPADTGLAANEYQLNDTTADTVTFLDRLADSAIISNELDYQNSGELDNVAPPAGSIITEGKDRIFLAGGDIPENQVVFSKLRFPQEPPEFNDTLSITVDQDGGPITALAILNENLVVFKERRIYVVPGAGPNNLGQGAFGQPQLLTTDVGCNNQRSIVPIPVGLMFQTQKGIYVLTQQLQTRYIGAAVERFNSQTVTSAELLQNDNEVRFLTDSGSTLSYNYLFNQWSTFTNHEGTSAVILNDVYYYGRNDGTVFQEAEGVFLDNGAVFKLAMETAWVKLRGLQGFQRIRRVHVLGEFKTTHTLRMEVGYDYEPGYVRTLVFDPAPALNVSLYGYPAGDPTATTDGTYGDPADEGYGQSSDSVYQFRAHMPKQKCQSIRFRFTEVPPQAGPGEAFELTSMMLQVGTKKGPYKLLNSSKAIG